MTAVVEYRDPGRERSAASPVRLAAAELGAGRMVVVYDDASGEGVLLLAAAAATKHAIAVMVRHTSGLLRAAMTGPALDRLGIPPMLPRHEDNARSRFAVAVDAGSGVTTGISAADRARTFRILADHRALPDDLIRPGHVIPERAVAGGVLERPGRAEAAVELVGMAGLAPAGVIGELVDDAGTVSSWTQSRKFADEFGLSLVTITQLVVHERSRRLAGHVPVRST